MSLVPSLLTERLKLRGFAPGDAPELASLLADGEVSSQLMEVPRPRTLQDAEAYIQVMEGRFLSGDGPVWAVTRREDSELLGAVSLAVCLTTQRAGLSFWIGKPFRKAGYATEAAFAALYFGFRKYRLNRIDAWHLGGDGAAARVFEKLGMAREASLRDHILKDGKYQDAICHAMLRETYESARVAASRFVVMIPRPLPTTTVAP